MRVTIVNVHIRNNDSSRRQICRHEKEDILNYEYLQLPTFYDPLYYNITGLNNKFHLCYLTLIRIFFA